MTLGNSGGKNKGKKYLKITGLEEISPENQAKADQFKEWFSKQYKRIQIELIAKRTYDEDMLNDTFLRIFDKILYGGLQIEDYKAYFHRAFFTNYVHDSIKKHELEHMIVSDEYAIDTLDESIEIIEEQQQKLRLYIDILQFVKEKYNEFDYNIFSTYVKLGSRKYEVVCEMTNTPYDIVLNIINKVRRGIRNNSEFARIRKSM